MIMLYAETVMAIQNEFSRQGDLYLAARPRWPSDLLAHLASLCPAQELAWDCATGNGQVAVGLAPHFDRVEATDISDEQIARAIPARNVNYTVSPAESSHLVDHSVDLITGGQAPQWVDLDRFYTEVRRVAKPGAVLAVFGSREVVVSPHVDSLTSKLMQEILGPHWYEKGKRLHDSRFQSLNFPFEKIEIPEFAIKLHCGAEAVLALYESYSGAQRYFEATGEKATDIIRASFIDAFGRSERDISIPIYHRVGRIK